MRTMGQLERPRQLVPGRASRPPPPTGPDAEKQVQRISALIGGKMGSYRPVLRPGIKKMGKILGQLFLINPYFPNQFFQDQVV